MKLNEVSDQEITELRGAYMRDLRTEKMASESVKRMWRIVIAALNEELKNRHGGVLPVIDHPILPGNEPLA